MDTQTVVFLSILTIVGALLGGAVGHWKRGGGAYIVSGAIIGGLSLAIFGLAAAVYAGVILAMAVVAVLALLAWNFLFG
jgi:hypothetical protein